MKNANFSFSCELVTDEGMKKLVENIGASTKTVRNFSMNHHRCKQITNESKDFVRKTLKFVDTLSLGTGVQNF